MVNFSIWHAILEKRLHSKRERSEAAMKQAGSAQVYLIAIVLIGLTGLMFLEPWVIRAALLLITVLCGYTAFKLEASRMHEKWSRELKQQDQQHDSNVLQIVNRLRHDWMNDMQILFGYIQLKKFDNLQPYMEKIKMNMQQESNLSKLGIPSLIAFLLLFRVQTKSLQLEIELDQEVNLGQLPLRQGLIETLVRKTVELFKQHAAAGGDDCGMLSLAFDAQEDGLLLDFVYQGPYDRDGLNQAVQDALQVKTVYHVLEQFDLQDEEVVLALRLPFRNNEV
ncbi:Spo0B domain-containing protein [Paenibacillus sedimenti]|uniref:Spo0B domain-containing protein n=1 Tax=Paenibacillus sedimenti TaxID=2770274 RepID=A0A926QJG9_9BACL|nr:Spo0B domain-containing protein [Paenibacillus sedimenti]MBD0381701.1 Spo0B domain-containing protein [Paenibacillus sedimenti]